MDWIDVAQDRYRWQDLVSVVINLQVPLNMGYFLTSWGPVSFSGKTVLHGVGCELVVALVNLVDVYKYFTETYCFHCQNLKWAKLWWTGS